MKRIYLFYLLAASLLLLVDACNKNDDPITEETDPDIPEATLATNEWIKENMEMYYLWNNQLPDIDYTKESDPEAYFYDLLYDVDTLSWVTDDYASLTAEYSGNPVTMGYDPTFYLFSDGSSVFAVVNYVYPESAAEEAGLERGDIILSINNTEINTTNYNDLFTGTDYSVELGIINDNTISYSGESLNLTARVTTTDPAIYHEVFNINGHKMAYLVYIEFVAGDNDQFLTKLDNIFNEFKEAGVSDLIVDLRYNPGGDIDAAAHLASEIAPMEVVANHDVLVNIQYNDDFQSFLESDRNEYEDYLNYKFVSDVSNLNMQRVYFLTTSGTASASELVISGLEPYMEVIHIGEPTYGKYTGAWVIPDDNDEWAMIPIVLKYSNVNDYTDFADGLTPDYKIQDDLIAAVPFGDTSDPMVAQAIELATGVTTVTAKTKSASIKSYKKLIPDEKTLKRNLFVPALEKIE